MDWSGNSGGFDPLGNPLVDGPAKTEVIELVGPHLRVHGTISLLRFNRLSDLLNHNRGYVKLSDARLMRRNGDPTNLVVPELMVNPEEITFIAQRENEISKQKSGLKGGYDRPVMERTRRELVIFTEGHTLSGTVFAFSDTDVGTFVDSPEPRFVPMVDVTARSLADRRIISHFALVLVNRGRMTAASLLSQAGAAAETGVVVE
jgi:hypothetical protein